MNAIGITMDDIELFEVWLNLPKLANDNLDVHEFYAMFAPNLEAIQWADPAQRLRDAILTRFQTTTAHMLDILEADRSFNKEIATGEMHRRLKEMFVDIPEARVDNAFDV